MKVMVVGCGSIGSWVVEMAKVHPEIEEVVVVDPDVVEERNLVRLPPRYAQFLGVPKVVVASLDSKKVVPVAEHVNEEHFAKFSPDMVIEATDSFNVQRDVYEWAQRHGAFFVSLRFDGDRFTVLSGLAPWSENEGGGYTQTNGPVYTAVLVASLGLGLGLKRVRKVISGSVGGE